MNAEHFAKPRSLGESVNTTRHTLDTLHRALAISEKLPLLAADSTLVKAARKLNVEATLVK